MPYADFDVETLAEYLHISPAQVVKMAERSTLPARKIGGQWKFSRAEIHHWLEERIGAGDDADLATGGKAECQARGTIQKSATTAKAAEADRF